MSRLIVALMRQLKNPLQVPEGGSNAPITDAVSVLVEQVGVVVVTALIGWWLASVLGSIWYFVGAVIFGAVGSVLRAYYRTKLEMDEAVNTFKASTSRRSSTVVDSGFSGLLEGIEGHGLLDSEEQ
ncbi:hypothetical protein SAMN02745225_01249 [Ferrithrix thermotolerans DSM 19514]|jgi:F0F1-type ATP synthase assembly protein I|uniref:Uncharacterized protein n=1 Tax=Ferrithrix thermotolerans DSM 19514 TaxID=1121881 RepID=A0A1M4VAH9_9ACTN|nr:hypothetical protein [Ferrithrix thermotolerans]SHE65996.1 hypothetical protein SAMN02745225_01249 [Ferrithrix thermotolerans DSM 19514]